MTDLLVEGVVFRLGAAHDVPVDVAASAERRQQSFIDPRDGLLEVAFEHAVELEVLARRHPQRSVGPLLTDVVVGDVCIRRHDAARNPGPDHQLVVLVEALGPRLLAAISVVLLIDPMELEQLLGIVTERRRVFDELLFDEPPQVVAGRLDGLVLGEAVERCAVGQIGQNGCASA